MTNNVRVVLADDHSLVRRGFRRILEDDQSIIVVGEASDGDEAIHMAVTLCPDVVVMDCAMGKTNGLMSTREIRRRAPAVMILVLSMHSEETLVRAALDAGARGYILKNALDLDLASAVKRIAAGEAVMDAAVSLPSTLKGERVHGLSGRELEVLQLICEGHSNRTIAAKLALSVNTVAVHRANIMTALGVHKTAELVVYAIRHGLVNML